MRISHKINYPHDHEGPEQSETGYGLLSRRRFDLNSFAKSLKTNFFQLITYMYPEVRRRVEFLQQSEVRSEIGAISAGIIDFVDRVFR